MLAAPTLHFPGHESPLKPRKPRSTGSSLKLWTQIRPFIFKSCLNGDKSNAKWLNDQLRAFDVLLREEFPKDQVGIIMDDHIRMVLTNHPDALDQKILKVLFAKIPKLKPPTMFIIPHSRASTSSIRRGRSGRNSKRASLSLSMQDSLRSPPSLTPDTPMIGSKRRSDSNVLDHIQSHVGHVLIELPNDNVNNMSSPPMESPKEMDFSKLRWNSNDSARSESNDKLPSRARRYTSSVSDFDRKIPLKLTDSGIVHGDTLRDYKDMRSDRGCSPSTSSIVDGYDYRETIENISFNIHRGTISEDSSMDRIRPELHLADTQDTASVDVDVTPPSSRDTPDSVEDGRDSNHGRDGSHRGNNGKLSISRLFTMNLFKQNGFRSPKIHEKQRVHPRSPHLAVDTEDHDEMSPEPEQEPTGRVLNIPGTEMKAIDTSHLKNRITDIKRRKVRAESTTNTCTLNTMTHTQTYSPSLPSTDALTGDYRINGCAGTELTEMDLKELGKVHDKHKRHRSMSTDSVSIRNPYISRWIYFILYLWSAIHFIASIWFLMDVLRDSLRGTFPLLMRVLLYFNIVVFCAIEIWKS